jgi:hypothetical protein
MDIKTDIKMLVLETDMAGTSQEDKDLLPPWMGNKWI